MHLLGYVDKIFLAFMLKKRRGIYMRQFKTVFTYSDKMWIASCDELRITLEEGSFDALVIRMKVAIQEIAELELEHKGDIKLLITMNDRIDEIKAVS
jgi:hypothetical protein